MLLNDSTAGTLDSRGEEFDSTRYASVMGDADLHNFFSRPLLIKQYEWEPDGTFEEIFNPFRLYFAHARVKEKLSYYFLFKATLHVKFVINGNPFYLGRMIACYEPMPFVDAYTGPRAPGWVTADLVRGSQMLHVYLNPTTCQGGEMILPFFVDANMLRLPNQDFTSVGRVIMKQMNQLEHVNAGDEPITISVFAWAEDVLYSIPTCAPYITTPEMDEYSQDFISRPASAVARAAHCLRDVPKIGKFARATEVGAKSVAKIARFFGFSSPVELEKSIIVPATRGSLAVTDMKYACEKLSLDSKCEVSIDPRISGLKPDDELVIASIAGRESYLFTFPWGIADEAGTLLTNMYVDPMLHAVDSDGGHHLPACAVASLPFVYWRGTMRFRFQIVSSMYHKGRIRIWYDPQVASNASITQTNLNYSMVHDISDDKDFTIDVGWAQSRSYSAHLQLGDLCFDNSDFLPAITNHIANGVLGVHVVNRLTCAGSSPVDVSVNVFVSMLPDFEVAQPSSAISHCRFRQPPVFPVGESAKDKDKDKLSRFPDSNDMTIIEMDEQDQQGNPVVDPPTIDTFASAEVDDPDVTKVYFGEVIASFRTLLKRTNLSEVIAIERDNENAFEGSRTTIIKRPSFPVQGGYYMGGVPATDPLSIVRPCGAIGYIPTKTTLLNFLGPAFLGWRGSLRWTADLSDLRVDSSKLSNTVVANRIEMGHCILETFSTDDLTDIEREMYELEYFRSADMLGMCIANTSVNPILSFEVPWYSNRRFLPTRTIDRHVAVHGARDGPGFAISFEQKPSAVEHNDVKLIKLFVAAGEDFNLLYFNGMPPIYKEDTYVAEEWYPA
jgi:hypothetical protein